MKTSDIFDLEGDLPTAFGLPVKRFASGKCLIMTQRRHVKAKRRATYDSVNHNRQECVAGLIHPGEDIITGLLRESEEECGMPPGWKPLRILGVSEEDLRNDNRDVLKLSSREDYDRALEIFTMGTPPDKRVWANGRGDHTLRYQPGLPIGTGHGYEFFCILQNLGEPQKWSGPVSVFVVPPRWQPKYRPGWEEGSGPAMWWHPYRLLQTMKESPDLFMGPVIPAYELLCEKLIWDRQFQQHLVGRPDA